jgi:hypothetical protein
MALPHAGHVLTDATVPVGAVAAMLLVSNPRGRDDR